MRVSTQPFWYHLVIDHFLKVLVSAMSFSITRYTFTFLSSHYVTTSCHHIMLNQNRHGQRSQH